MNYPWLTLLALVPLLGSLVVFGTPRENHALSKVVGLGFAGVTLLGTILLALNFDGTDGYAFVETHDWIPSFGIEYAVGLDGISLLMVAMTAVLVFISMLAGWSDGEDSNFGSVRGFVALTLMLESFVLMVFMATDVFLFYVFFEAMLVPMYFLIGGFGGAKRSYAAVKFFIYSLVGGLLMLAALVGLYAATAEASDTGIGTFDITKLAAMELDPELQKILFLGFFVAFAIKAPMWPLHTWLPDAAAEARPSSAVLLVGVLDKVGTFGMLRYCLPIFPEASKFYAPAVIVLCVVGIIYGALLAIGQTDIKRLIAYTSLSHFGFIIMGIFAMTTVGQAGAGFYMFNHGFSIAAMFIVTGYLFSRNGGSRNISDYAGVHKVAPVLTGVFLLAGLSSLAMPGMSSFTSEIMVLMGSYQTYPVQAVVATLGIVLAAIYVLYLFQRTMTGPVKEGLEGMRDLSGREVVAVAPAIALILFFGAFPQFALDVINPTVQQTLSGMNITDPAPAVPVQAAVEGASK
jgi:NADH-quinone oxidoreductase subunit M